MATARIGTIACLSMFMVALGMVFGLGLNQLSDAAVLAVCGAIMRGAEILLLMVLTVLMASIAWHALASTFVSAFWKAIAYIWCRWAPEEAITKPHTRRTPHASTSSRAA